MAPHSSTLAWKIPWMEKPGGLQSMGSRRVKYDWATSLSLSLFILGLQRWPEDHSNNCNNNNNKASICWVQDIVLTHCHISQQSYELVGSFITLILQMKKIEAPRVNGLTKCYTKNCTQADWYKNQWYQPLRNNVPISKYKRMSSLLHTEKLALIPQVFCFVLPRSYTLINSVLLQLFA